MPAGKASRMSSERLMYVMYIRFNFMPRGVLAEKQYNSLYDISYSYLLNHSPQETKRNEDGKFFMIIQNDLWQKIYFFRLCLNCNTGINLLLQINLYNHSKPFVRYIKFVLHLYEKTR